MSLINDNMHVNTLQINENIHIHENISYYKAVGLNAHYLVSCEDYKDVSLQQKAVEMYTYSTSGLLKVKGYIKAIENSDILLIAAPNVTSHFKMFDVKK